MNPTFDHFITWNTILTILLIPTVGSIFLYFVKRMFDKRDKGDSEKDKLILKLQADCDKSKERENSTAHDRIFKELTTLNVAIKDNAADRKKSIDNLYDELKGINTTMSLINGTVKDTKEQFSVHLVKGH